MMPWSGRRSAGGGPERERGDGRSMPIRMVVSKEDGGASADGWSLVGDEDILRSHLAESTGSGT